MSDRHEPGGYWDKVGMGVRMTNLRAENARLKAVLGDYVDANQRDQKKIKELESEPLRSREEYDKLRAENTKLKGIVNELQEKIGEIDYELREEKLKERRGLADLPKTVAQAALDRAPESLFPPKQYVPAEPAQMKEPKITAAESPRNATPADLESIFKDDAPGIGGVEARAKLDALWSLVEWMALLEVHGTPPNWPATVEIKRLLGQAQRLWKQDRPLTDDEMDQEYVAALRKSLLLPNQYAPKAPAPDPLLHWMHDVTDIMRRLAPNDWEALSYAFVKVKDSRRLKP